MWWQHILQYWVEYLCGLIALAFGFLSKMLWSRFNIIKKENDGIKHGVKALLHNEIIKMGRDLIDKGYCSPEEFEEFDYLYHPYHNDLAGNGSAERMRNQVIGLPQTPEQVSEQ